MYQPPNDGWPVQQQEQPPRQNYTGQPMAQYPAMPPQTYSQQPPPQGYPQPQPMQNYQQPGYPPMQQPYPQQQYYQQPPQQIVINNQVTANATVATAMQQPQHPSMIIRLIYFCFVGWWLGMFWLGIALLLICSVLGAPGGVLMLAKTSKVFFL